MAQSNWAAEHSERKAVLRLNRVERELGADGSALVHDVLVQGMTMEQVGQRRGLCRLERLLFQAIPQMSRSAGDVVRFFDGKSRSAKVLPR